MNSDASVEAPTPCIVVLGTCDTKLEELLYLRTHLQQAHRVHVKLFDVGRTPSSHPAVDLRTQSAIVPTPPSSPGATPDSSPAPTSDITQLPRASFIAATAARISPLLTSLIATYSIHGLISVGGSCGSTLAADVFSALPLGFPKLLVSTIACGDVAPLVRGADVALMYSVVDIAGLNDILCPVLENAAGAIAGMAAAYIRRIAFKPLAEGGKSEGQGKREMREKRVAITMYGVTTPAVTRARELLARYPCTTYVFHATGAGGRTMERLVSEGFFDGVLDLTTTELADELVGGVMSAGPHRLEAAAKKGVPQVVSLGALDMVTFGPRASVPEKWSAGQDGKGVGRKFVEHNSSVTIMRTTKEECAQLGKILAGKLQEAQEGKSEVWIPRGGISLMCVKGGVFEDAEADQALFDALKEGLRQNPADQNAGQSSGRGTRLIERDEDINDPVFAEGMVGNLVRMMGLAVSE